MRRSGAPSQRFMPPAASKIDASSSSSWEAAGLVPVQRRPLVSMQQQPQSVSAATAGMPGSSLPKSSSDGDDETRYFSAMYCKSSTRKHKKYEDDAMLVVRSKTRLAVLKDSTTGKEIARGSGLQMSKLEELGSGGQISFGGKDVEVMEELSRTNFESAMAANVQAADSNDKGDKRPKAPPTTKRVFKPFSAPARFGVVPKNNCSTRGGPATRPMFNVNHPDALVLPRPPFHAAAAAAMRLGTPDTDGAEEAVLITDVVVDPHLSRQLRPHQAAGVVFLYRCVMGFNEGGYKGAILADEMGLGKTLQTITIIWTLLRQGPWGGKPVAKRVLILAPSSLVRNWQAEFCKWLGSERISVFAVDQSNRVTEYLSRQNTPVLIMSYEMFVRYQARLV